MVVFRNGSIFETFVDDDVDPVGILEGMFGRVRGGRAQAADGVNGGNPAGAMPMPSGQERPGEASLKPAPLTGKDVTHVKIVDFDKERQNSKRGHDRIKVSYFD